MVERLKTEQDLTLEWRPFLLRPDMPQEGMRLPEYLRQRYAVTGERLRNMAHEAGMEFVQPEFIPNSRRALEASEYAREEGVHEPFHQAVFRKFFGEGLDISDWEVLGAAAEGVGLDPAAMRRETESGQYSERVVGHYAQALSMGITSIPTYVLNDRYAIVGAQPYELFEATLERIASDWADPEAE